MCAGRAFRWRVAYKELYAATVDEDGCADDIEVLDRDEYEGEA